jgi:hypothetical protein
LGESADGRDRQGEQRDDSNERDMHDRSLRVFGILLLLGVGWFRLWALGFGMTGAAPSTSAS